MRSKRRLSEHRKRNELARLVFEWASLSTRKLILRRPNRQKGYCSADENHELMSDQKIGVLISQMDIKKSRIIEE